MMSSTIGNRKFSKKCAGYNLRKASVKDSWLHQRVNWYRWDALDRTDQPRSDDLACCWGPATTEAVHDLSATRVACLETEAG